MTDEERTIYVGIDVSKAKLAIADGMDRDFTAERPNQKWAGDISYIWT